MARVVELVTYPVKGCAGMPVRETAVTAAGLAHDRGFMVVDEDGRYRTQRRDPLLATIRPVVGDDGRLLTLDAPGAGTLAVPVDTEGVRRPVVLFGAAYRGIDQGDTVAAWLTGVLRAPSRLVRVPPEHDRVTDGRTPGTSGYADSCALHLLSRASLEVLDRKLAERGAAPLPVGRFRPNVLVDGWDEPHTEDRAHLLTVGTAELAYAKLALRCAVTMVRQETGERAGPEPLRTLASYRRAAEGGVAFRTKLAVQRPGRVAVGDEVTVTVWGRSELGVRPGRGPGGAPGSGRGARTVTDTGAATGPGPAPGARTADGPGRTLTP